MRSGYPAPWTFGEQLDAGWFGSGNDPRFQHWQRVSAIRVDGQRLYNTHPLRRTPSLHERRFSQKFGEVLIAAHALAQLDITDIAIETGGATPHECPDLHAVMASAEIGIEVGEVHPNAAATNAAIDLDIALKELIDDDPALQPTQTYLHICRLPGRHSNAAVLPRTRKRLLTVVADLLRSGIYREWLAKGAECAPEWAGAELGYTIHVARSLIPTGYILFDDSTCSFNPEALIAPALRMLKHKRRQTAHYDRKRPLWMIIGLTEERGIFTASLERLAQLAAQIEPFERVIAHDGMTYVTYACTAA